MGSMEKFEAELRGVSFNVASGFDSDKELLMGVANLTGSTVSYLTKPQVEELANHLLNVLDEEEK